LATTVIKNPRPYTTRLHSEGISQIKDSFSKPLSLKKIKHSAEQTVANNGIKTMQNVQNITENGGCFYYKYGKQSHFL